MYQYRSRTLSKCAALVLLTTHMGVAATPLSSAPKVPLPSSFPGPLWDLVAPQGGTASVSNAHLFLNVPGGKNHDALTQGNEAVRLIQPIANTNFDVSIKIDSPVTATDADTSQGLMVVTDDQNYLTFAVTTNGTSISLNAHAVAQGTANTLFDHQGFQEYQNPLYLRLGRNGSAYTAYYSVDGNVWTQAGTFSNGLEPAAVGPFAGNYNANPARAVPVVMAINWFHVL